MPGPLNRIAASQCGAALRAKALESVRRVPSSRAIERSNAAAECAECAIGYII